jgi:hypothetical protein
MTPPCQTGVDGVKTRLIALLIGASFCHVPAVQSEPTLPARANGYDRLAPLIGRWTQKGRESSYVETCRWFDGRYHVVCDTEFKRADGSTGRGMSILGYVADEDRYVYVGIGSNGRTETMSGTFRDGVLEFTPESTGGGMTGKSRVRMGPVAGREVPFVAESSMDGVAWTTEATITYIRLD